MSEEKEELIGYAWVILAFLGSIALIMLASKF